MQAERLVILRLKKSFHLNHDRAESCFVAHAKYLMCIRDGQNEPADRVGCRADPIASITITCHSSIDGQKIGDQGHL